MKVFSFHQRSKIITQMSEDTFDLVIIGGGINGAGVARDAALRGMKVALIEASDFASGTSSRSSKLVHGGLRYLENMEFKLVFEALSERQKLFEMAPHLVHPLRFMIPLYAGGRVGMFMMGLGMWVYDALSLFQAPELHERLSPGESLERMPLLQGRELLGSYIYSDAYMDDDRLVHETLRSAVSGGALCASYVVANGAEFNSSGNIVAVKCTDQESGKKFIIKTNHVVSSVGPWTDQMGSLLLKKWKNVLRPTKGIHLTFEKKRLPISSAVVMAAEKRIVFAIPRHEMVIVGTTDTDFSGDPADVVASPEDVEYVLGIIDKYFPGAAIKANDILASYAGVRPLVHDGSASEGKTSREHTIFTTDEKITFVAGGKYTTYRLMAEQTVDEVLKHFSIESRAKWNRCETEKPLNPQVTLETQGQKKIFIEKLVGLTQWDSRSAAVFFDRHGGEALSIVEKFGSHHSPIELEALQAIESTMCFHLVDFYARRVPLFLAERDHGKAQLGKVVDIFTQALSWTSETAMREKKLLDGYIQRELSWFSALKPI